MSCKYSSTSVQDVSKPPQRVTCGRRAGICVDHAAVHLRIDEDRLAHWQIAIRFGQVTDKFMPEHNARLSADVFTRGDVQISATDPGVRDVHCHPARRASGTVARRTATTLPPSHTSAFC